MLNNKAGGCGLSKPRSQVSFYSHFMKSRLLKNWIGREEKMRLMKDRAGF